MAVSTKICNDSNRGDVISIRFCIIVTSHIFQYSQYMELKIPESLELEHEELHEQVFNGIKEGGKLVRQQKL